MLSSFCKIHTGRPIRFLTSSQETQQRKKENAKQKLASCLQHPPLRARAGWRVLQHCHPATQPQLSPAHREREQQTLWQVTLKPFTFGLLQRPHIAQVSPLVTQLPHPHLFLACLVKIFLLFPHTRISPVASCSQSGWGFFLSHFPLDAFCGQVPT